MQVRTKGGTPIISLTKPELQKLDEAAAILREIARYPERFPQAGNTSTEIAEIAKAFRAAE